MFLNKYYGDNVTGIMSPKGNAKLVQAYYWYNVKLEKKMPSKPCNNNYNVISDEARKNAHVRYYFENNISQFDFI